MGEEDLDVLIELMANSPKPEDSGKSIVQHDPYDEYTAHDAPMLPWRPLNDLQLEALGVDIYLYRKGLPQL